MTNKFVTLTAVAALSLAPAVTFAQSAAPGSTTPPAASPVAPDAGTPQAPASEMPNSPSGTMNNSTAPATDNSNAAQTTVPATPKFVSTQSSGQWLGSDLMGTAVVTSNDESLGSISDVVIDRDGSIVAAVIDVGGFLGIGAKPVAVSFESLTPTPTDNGQKIVVAMTKEELNSAPEFKSLDDNRSEGSSATGTAAPATTN